jgi:hypothetical protein
MADNSKKVSELPNTTNAASTDRILILRSPASNASVRTITANDFIGSFKTSFANTIPDTTVVANSVTVASNGTSNVAFFSYTIGAGKTGCCDVILHARDATSDSTTAAHILIVANNSAVDFQPTAVEVGIPAISFNVTPTLSSNIVTLSFVRTGAATSNVSVRFSATIY